MLQALQFEFMQNALLSGLLAAILCAVLGTLVVVRRIVFMAGGIAHSAYGGVGIAVFFGWSINLTTLGFCFLMVLIMTHLSKNQPYRADALIGVMWSFGMAVGIILSDLTPSYQGDLISVLFGSILAVSKSDILMLMIALVMVISFCLKYYKTFVVLSFDEQFAQAMGIKSNRLNTLLLMLVGFCVVFMIKLVGLILVIALISTAPLAVEKYSKSLIGMMFYSSILNIAMVLGGIFLSYKYNVSASASIIGLGVLFYLMFYLIDLLQDSKKKSHLLMK